MSSTDKTTALVPAYLPSLALFGSTGGCLLSTLLRLLNTPSPTGTLNPPQHVSVLVRSTSKLETLLTTKGVPKETISARLRIVEGDILTDFDKVVETITLPPDNIQSKNKRFVDVVLFGIGGYPRATFVPPFIKLDNPTICQDGMSAVLNALQQPPAHSYHSEPAINKPLVLAISSTGLYRGGEDDPRDLYIPMLIMYKCLLGGPHKDKIAMEDVLTAAAGSDVNSDAKSNPLCDYIVVRGALFNDQPAEAKPLRAGYPKRVPGVGEGVKWGDVAGPAIGCGVSREDVGRWVWEEVASGRTGWNEQGEYVGEWKGKKVTLTN